ncbi:FGGY-family carbohydrate kinase [Mucilaginibacter sp.]|uniref:FGGY-family carbohydrate kinase n=1 Tax=Mucilaginibacter sp. TaxID=1882438 RepID=UPI002CA704FA|nr:FGGY family carbohydrate kinase [Mucilaginibacter sp.]HTI60820.1 FGGY family carbohydrate kinase [Mucilaginibacter sp.]
MKPVIAIFDIGKTNKKLFLFDEDYGIVYERSTRLPEITDEDGFPCEDVDALSKWVAGRLKEASGQKEFAIKAVNFSGYGASLVYVDGKGKPLSPLYNYLKPYPEDLSNELYAKYGGQEQFCIDTASPALGSLNSGLQLYRVKKEQPAIFEKLKYALHLPQYISYLVSDEFVNDITGIGCHTAMWNFQTKNYHKWIGQERLESKFPPVVSAEKVFENKRYKVGAGLHDSSAALIPYLINIKEPFVLLSTGTWSISLNPFDHSELTADELGKDCLCYLQYTSKPVKASRLFAGYEHEQQVKRIATHFKRDVSEFDHLRFDDQLAKELEQKFQQDLNPLGFTKSSGFEQRDLPGFVNYIEAYHQLVCDLVKQQSHSTRLVLKESGVKKLFVDGGFSHNEIYMNLLAREFCKMEVFAASVAQASAMGAALVIHSSWNPKPVAGTLIGLKRYSNG